MLELFWPDLSKTNARAQTVDSLLWPRDKKPDIRQKIINHECSQCLIKKHVSFPIMQGTHNVNAHLIVHKLTFVRQEERPFSKT